ncbi:GRIP domain [Carpediemonas membranifera]|uniref:GRIP domain n=1 Tax=Carpediemonas membranifera TaxID=201153 RepID=A0A8J6BE86_9EUKA|nr:GRIP domain [Carpediemonas membranifera]|eukprot:KAG9395637.1 GRIP domain [Carpediemonas membranifera]
MSTATPALSDEKLQSTVKRLKALVVKLNEKCDQLKAENTYLTTSLATADGSLETVSSERDELVEENKKQREQLGSLQTELETSRSSIVTLETTLAELRAEFAAHKEQTNQLLQTMSMDVAEPSIIPDPDAEDFELDRAREDNAGLLIEIGQLREQLANCSRERGMLNEELSAAHERVVGLRREAVGLRKADRDARRELAAVREELARANHGVQPTADGPAPRPADEETVDQPRMDALSGELAELRDMYAHACEQLAYFKNESRQDSADVARARHIRSLVLAFLCGADSRTVVPVLCNLLSLTEDERAKVRAARHGV